MKEKSRKLLINSIIKDEFTIIVGRSRNIKEKVELALYKEGYELIHISLHKNYGNEVKSNINDKRVFFIDSVYFSKFQDFIEISEYIIFFKGNLIISMDSIEDVSLTKLTFNSCSVFHCKS